jgi:hypothetical protein
LVPSNLPASRMSCRKSGEFADVSQSDINPSGVMPVPPAAMTHLSPHSPEAQFAELAEVAGPAGAVGALVGPLVAFADGFLLGEAVYLSISLRVSGRVQAVE